METHDSTPARRSRPGPSPSGADRAPLDFKTWLATRGPGQVQKMFAEVRREDLEEPKHLLTLGKKQLEMMLWGWAVETLRVYCEACPGEKKGAALYAEALAEDPIVPPGVAEEALRHALALDPKNARCHALLGGTLRAQDREDDALASYEQAFALGVKDDVAWFDVAEMHVQAGRIDDAEAVLRRAEPHVEDRAMLVELLAEVRRKREKRR